jgi:hypothetical protein
MPRRSSAGSRSGDRVRAPAPASTTCRPARSHSPTLRDQSWLDRLAFRPGGCRLLSCSSQTIWTCSSGLTMKYTRTGGAPTR